MSPPISDICGSAIHSVRLSLEVARITNFSAEAFRGDMDAMSEPETIAISNLGVCEVHVAAARHAPAVEDTFVTDSTFVRRPLEIDTAVNSGGQLFEKDGPREKSFLIGQRQKRRSLPAEESVPS